MIRISKQAQKRSVSPKRPKLAGQKTGPQKDNLKKGYKEKFNAVKLESIYISKL